jgi:hypothetical protein
MKTMLLALKCATNHQIWPSISRDMPTTIITVHTKQFHCNLNHIFQGACLFFSNGMHNCGKRT